MEIQLRDENKLFWPTGRCPVIIGAGGLVNEKAKLEGDGATPIGQYSLRRVLFRADRVAAPQTTLSCRALCIDDGWCDDATDPAYNRPVRLPYPASAEQLFRDDRVYDLIVVLGHNDQPPTLGHGSAIFLHLARETGAPTRGCLAVSEADLRTLLRQCTPASQVIIAGG